MHNPNAHLIAAILFVGAQPATACDPVVTPAQEVLARRDLGFVIGRYAANGTFLVEETIGAAVPLTAYRILERGPFGSQCEVSTMAVSSPAPRPSTARTRFLLPIEARDVKRRQLRVVMGYPYRLVVDGDTITDQYFDISSRLSDLRRATAKAASPRRR